MNVKEIRKLVEKKASELLLNSTIDFMTRQHKNNGFKSDCSCSYCSMKRTATYEIRNIFYDENIRYFDKKIIRNKYRKQLEELV